MALSIEMSTDNTHQPPEVVDIDAPLSGSHSESRPWIVGSVMGVQDPLRPFAPEADPIVNALETNDSAIDAVIANKFHM